MVNIQTVYSRVNIVLTASVHGSLIGRFNYRRTGVVASLLAGVFLMLSALAPSIHVLFFTYALGLGECSIMCSF